MRSKEKRVNTYNKEHPTYSTTLSSIAVKGKTLKNALFVLIGLISLALGVVGIIMPLLPTTPFLLLSAACFAKRSTKLYNWLHTNPVFGEYLRRYRNKEGIPIEMKVGVLSLLWITLASSAFLALSPEQWYVRLFLLAVGIGVTIHILKIKTSRRKIKSEDLTHIQDT